MYTVFYNVSTTICISLYFRYFTYINQIYFDAYSMRHVMKNNLIRTTRVYELETIRIKLNVHRNVVVTRFGMWFLFST